MAQVVKRCKCPRSKWAKCPHSWTVRWWDDRQREKSFKRNHQAAVKFSKTIDAEKLSEKRSIHYGDPVPITLREYAETWLPTIVAAGNTRRIYRNAFNNHILPVFGDRKLEDVAADREGVTSFLAGLTNGTAASCRTALRACLSEAIRAGKLTSTRLAGVRVAQAESSAAAVFTFPTREQFTALVEAMPERLRPSVFLMRGCGLRRGEVLAVHASGFADGRLRLTEQQLQDGTRAPLKSRKAGEYRDVPVPDYVAAEVAKLGADGYLFEIPTSTFNRAFRVAATAAGLPAGFRMHDLRHCFASVALQRGVPVTDVARWLGHRNIQVTYATYSHFIPSAWDTARAALDTEYEEWSAA